MRRLISLLTTTCLGLGALTLVPVTAQAQPDEPRYCSALVDALAAAPDSSLFPMTTKKKRRLVERAIREQNRLFRKAYLIAKADGDLVVANGLYWNGKETVGNMKAYREFTAGDAQAKRDCGVGFFG